MSARTLPMLTEDDLREIIREELCAVLSPSVLRTAEILQRWNDADFSLPPIDEPGAQNG